MNKMIITFGQPGNEVEFYSQEDMLKIKIWHGWAYLENELTKQQTVQLRNFLNEYLGESNSASCASHVQPEPKSISTDRSRNVTEQVIADLNERTRQGVAKYGHPLQTHNGRNALVDAYQECLDQAQYLKQAIMEQEDANLPTDLPGLH